MREKIYNLVQSIDSIDDLEQQHKEDVLEWIESGQEIFRIEKPDKPNKHLVSYFVVADVENKKFLLVDHIKAELWLPTGGHVEYNEDPKTTVEREAEEELAIQAQFLKEESLFITVTTTVGKTAGHVDVSFWYVLSGNINMPITYDPGEFNGYKWFGFDEVLGMDIKNFDPHLHRFTRKLQKYLKQVSA